MLCLIAGNYQEARMFAVANGLDDNEWFYPMEPEAMLARTNFHVLVIGSAGENLPVSFFNRVYNLAKERGKIDRK